MDNNIDEIIHENNRLKHHVNELEERLKKYTSGKNHKKYYEKNKEKVIYVEQVIKVLQRAVQQR